VRRPETIRAALLASALFLLPGCGKKEEPPPPPPPPPAKVEVKAETVDEVMQRLGVDKRLRMDESERPNSGEATKDLERLELTLKFFDAMVTGKADALRPMLSPLDAQTLDAMQKDGQWKRASEGIERATLGCSGDKVLAIYTLPDRFDAQLWELREADGKVQFAAIPQPPNIMDRLQGTKADPRIQQWMKIVKELADKASEPDETPEMPQQDRSVGGEGGGSGSDAPSSSPGPSGPKTPGKP
jgi:hypothetical protein